MAKEQNHWVNAVQLTAAMLRASYGDMTGLTAQAIKYAPKILAICLGFVLLISIILISPATMLMSILSPSAEPSNENIPPGGIVMEALAYGEDWIVILAVAQTKKIYTTAESIDLQVAANAVKNGSIEAYLTQNMDEKEAESILNYYRNNLEFIETTLGCYAGDVYYYDEIPLKESYDSINLQYDEASKKHCLTARKDGGQLVIYRSNDVVNYKIDVRERKIKLKYRKFGLKAYFPIPQEYTASFSNDFGNPRNNNGQEMGHEGNDIFAARNTPIVVVEDCHIEKIGWNGLGGWRITMISKDGHRVYYCAHMERYADSLEKYRDWSGKTYLNPGVELKAGETIGYVGSSGGFSSSSPPGTDTGTPTHLHFQMWLKDEDGSSGKETLINPYYHLKLLENNKYSREREEQDEYLKKEGL